MDDGGQFVFALQINVKAGEECSVKSWDDLLARRKNLLDQETWVVLRNGQRGNAGGEVITSGQFKGIENVECAEDIWHQTICGLVVADVVANEDFIRALKLTRFHFPKTLDDLLCAEEFASRCLGELEAFWGLDFFEFGQDFVAEGLFRMSKNIEASDPASDCDANEYQYEYGPAKKAVLIFARGFGWVGVGVLKPGAAVFCFWI